MNDTNYELLCLLAHSMFHLITTFFKRLMSISRDEPESTYPTFADNIYSRFEMIVLPFSCAKPQL